MLEYKETLPDIDDYFDLFLTTGWNDDYKFNKKDLENALQNSWYKIFVYDSEKLIGSGRIISDGVHHALIVDLIINPKNQSQGIGTILLKKLVDRCQQSSIRDIQLFAAKDKYMFYSKLNFEIRPENAPGMQLKSTY